MVNTNLHKILGSFNKYEINRLKKFLNSPYFNSDDRIVCLFEFIIKEISKGKTQNLTKEKIWKQINPSKKFDDVRYRKYCSDLLKLIEGFLAQESFEQDSNLKYSKLIQSVGQKKIEFIFSKIVNKAKKNLDSYQVKDGYSYYLQYRFEQDFYDLYEDQLKRSSIGNIEQIGLNIDCFFIAEKLKLYCTILAKSGVFVAGEHDFKMMDEIFEFLKTSDYLHIPVISIYFRVLLTFKEPENFSHYHELKSLLKNHIRIFNKKEAHYVYSFAMNYCVKQLNKGNGSFLGELFDLYIELINKKIILYNNDELSPWDFKNINLVALRLGKYDWAGKFIEQYQKFLPEKFRKNAVSFNLAQLFYYQKKHEKVIEQLRDVEYEDLSYNLNSKTMLIGAYYELGDLEPLYSMFESFRAYLNRHKEIPTQRREAYLNYIKFTKKLTSVSFSNKDVLKKLKDDITIEKKLGNKQWLIEKVNEFL